MDFFFLHFAIVKETNFASNESKSFFMKFDEERWKKLFCDDISISREEYFYDGGKVEVNVSFFDEKCKQRRTTDETIEESTKLSLWKGFYRVYFFFCFLQCQIIFYRLQRFAFFPIVCKKQNGKL
jgi:hypothetical protein